ncbi:MAG: NAD(P)/FAD-dependent oxidoreductase [Christensenellales bacterium]
MNICIIGGGAAGMMCAITAARQGGDVTVIEKNEKLGKKIYITGKGRCNLTNGTDFDGYMNNIVTNKKFLYASLKDFDSEKCMDFFESLGLKLKVERGNRVFPQSDKSSDVIKVLERELRRLGVNVRLNEKVLKITAENGKIAEVITDKNAYRPDRTVICTGGLSYPATGSTGDGLRFAATLGHTIIPPVPALCGLTVGYALNGKGEKIPIASLPYPQGLSLKNVSASVLQIESKRRLFYEFGEMLFTENGVSGPIILTLSSKINRINPQSILLEIDLKPALSESKLDERILRDFENAKNKMLRNALYELLPSSMVPFIVALSGINPDKTVNSVSREERKTLVRLLKNLTLVLFGTEKIETAIVTSGGVSVKEINPKNMQSKLIGNLSFAGEAIDVDALTGGFNLQLAFATGYAAGKHIYENNEEKEKKL